MYNEGWKACQLMLLHILDVALVAALQPVGGFPRPQIAPSIMTEAFQEPSLFPAVGGPVCKTVGIRGGRQSSIVHLQVARMHGGKTRYNQDFSLQDMGWPLTSNDCASRKDHSGSIK